MKKLKCAVIGVGYLGHFHAQKYQHIEHASLVGVCDVNSEVVKKVSESLNVPAFTDYHQLLNQVDAVSIAASTPFHYEIAKDCLVRGIHVLLEKPMTQTVSEAQALIELAKKNHAKLQIGHLERFNAAHLALAPYLHEPLFIESNRLAPYTPRGADVNVILDLMIHDIDLIQSIVNSPIRDIDAQGAPVLSQSIDIANARITFANGCVANVTASRVSFKAERKMRIFQPKCYISLDYQEKKFAIFEKGDGEMFPGIPNVLRHQVEIEKNDALFEEIQSFVNCILNDTPPLVTGEQGKAALATAAEITTRIEHHLTQHHSHLLHV